MMEQDYGDNMNFDFLDIEPDSVTIELDNADCYRPAEPVTVKVGDKEATQYDTNVITIDDLAEGTKYSICVNGIQKDFCTLKQTVLLNVRQFGALGDGRHNDTSAVQCAINACPQDGTVLLPKGTYLCGPLFLKDDLRIKIDSGAILKGDPDRAHYPVLPGMTLGCDEEYEYNLGTWEGNPLSCFASLITGINVKNVCIYGKGCIDGNAAEGDWWQDAKVKRTAWRPRLLYFCRCENVTVNGIKVCNSPSWTVHPYYCDNINLIGMTIRNPDNSPNTDGIDPESCQNVNIIGTDISVGDDCIAIKSGKYYMARNHHKRTENISVRNCILNHGHGSVTIGSECAGGVRNVNVKRCIFNETDRGLRIKSRRGRGSLSVLEDIVFENIIMESVRMPFTVNMFYFCDPDGHSDYAQSKEALEVDEMTPRISSIYARNIVCRNADVCIFAAYGLPESKIGYVSLENIDAAFKPKALQKSDVPLMMDGLDPMKGKAIFARNVSKLKLNNITICGSMDSKPDILEVDDIEEYNLDFSQAVSK